MTGDVFFVYVCIHWSNMADAIYKPLESLRISVMSELLIILVFGILVCFACLHHVCFVFNVDNISGLSVLNKSIRYESHNYLIVSLQKKGDFVCSLIHISHCISIHIGNIVKYILIHGRIIDTCSTMPNFIEFNVMLENANFIW